MSIAVGSRSSIGAIVETVWGTTPSTPALLELPFTGFNVNPALDKYLDQSIRGDRMLRPSVSGNKHVTGDLDVAYGPLNYDSLLESLFSSAFSGSVLKVGATRKSFTLEHCQPDISQFFQYSGMIVDKLALKLSTTGIVTAKFSFIGKDSPTVTVSSIDTVSGSGVNTFYTAAQVALPFIHNGGTFKEGGSAFASFMSLDITFENKATSNFALGASIVRDFSSNFFEVSGTAAVYLEDAVLYNKFVNATASSVDFTLANGTNTHEFNIPNVRYHGAAKVIAGQGPVSLSMPFVGFYDAGTASNVVVTKG
jgi:hypothetical protein